MWEPWVQSLGWEDHLKEGMAIHSSILAWKIPWTEDPDRLQSMGRKSQTRLSDYTTPTTSSGGQESTKDTGRVGSFQGPEEWLCSRPPLWLINNLLHVHMALSPCECLSPISRL